MHLSRILPFILKEQIHSLTDHYTRLTMQHSHFLVLNL